MVQCTRGHLINILADAEVINVFVYVAALSTYVQVDRSSIIRKVAESNVEHFEYEMSNAKKFIYIDAIK